MDVFPVHEPGERTFARTLILAAKSPPHDEASAIERGERPRTFPRELARRLRGTLLTLRDAESSTHPLVRLAARKSDMWALAALGMTLRKRYDRFLVTGENIGVPFGRMMLAAMDFGRVTLPVHRADEPTTQKRLKQLGSRIWQNTIVVADSQADLLLRIGYPRHKIHRFTNMNPDVDFFRPQDGAATGDYVFTCGREGRDYGTLQRAAAMSTRPFRVVGSGLAPTLDFASSQVVVASSNMLLERNVSYAELRSAYQNARLFVMPLTTAQHAAGATAVGEAMAMGKPVVASDSPGIREYVRHGRSGLLVPVGDAEALHRAIEELWNDPERCAAMGAYNRAWAERSMNLMHCVDQVCGLYGMDPEARALRLTS